MKKMLLSTTSLLLVASLAVLGDSPVQAGKENHHPPACNKPFSTIQNPESLFTVFDPGLANEHFKAMDAIMPYHIIKSGNHSPQPKVKLNKGLLNTRYTFNGTTAAVSSLLDRTNTNAFIVSKKGKIVAEQYFNGYNACSTITSWSIAKSFLSVALGVAVEEGSISSLNDLVTKYVPSLESSGYNGVTIKQVLEMSSGVKFNEDYTDLNSDINFLIPYMVLDNGSVDEFTAALPNEAPAGIHKYKSIDTQVIGMIIKGATGMNASKYIEQKIWKPSEMSADAFWNTDLRGNEISFAMLNAKPRDYLKFGQLMLDGGEYKGKQLVSEEWIEQSVTPGRPELYPGNADPYFGYGYQWWIPNGADYGEEFVAIGIYGQYIYINEEEDIVIVKFSSDPAIIMNDAEVVEAFRAIAKKS
ncbi:serine hydrolase domain-containing protein [Paenibacillus sp. GCM10027627]|uniref:serine hydrolase domain-containing protein n=1 Tax=unclassified Paenibacillus TaxID=185978 RepID=UPI00363008DE